MTLYLLIIQESVPITETGTGTKIIWNRYYISIFNEKPGQLLYHRKTDTGTAVAMNL